MKRFILLLALSFALAAPARAETLAYLNIPGIPGDSAVRGHEKQIDISSLSLGLKGPVALASSLAARAGSPTFSPITILKHVDLATTNLFLACAFGTSQPTAEIFIDHHGENNIPFFKITLYNVVVVSFNTQTVEAGTAPDLIESIALSYSKIKIEYTTHNPDGSVGKTIEATFDLQTGKSS